MDRRISTPGWLRAGTLAGRVLATTLMLIGLAACGDSGSTATGPAEQSTLVVKNDAAQPIMVVQFARCTDPDWGPDRLGATETIAPGATRSWSIAPGCWDLRVATATRAGYWYDNEVQAGGSLQFALPAVAATSSMEPMMPGELKR
jgi:hypothetical protein